MNAQKESLEAIIDRRAHERREHERMTTDRRRKPRQTFAMFQAHVEAYLANKKRRRKA